MCPREHFSLIFSRCPVCRVLLGHLFRVPKPSHRRPREKRHQPIGLSPECVHRKCRSWPSRAARHFCTSVHTPAHGGASAIFCYSDHRCDPSSTSSGPTEPIANVIWSSIPSALAFFFTALVFLHSRFWVYWLLLYLAGPPWSISPIFWVILYFFCMVAWDQIYYCYRCDYCDVKNHRTQT